MINRVVIIGRIAKEDPVIKKTPSGKSVCTISLAVYGYKNREGQKCSKFFTVEAWERTADFLGMNCHKGDTVCVEGMLDYDEWTNSNNQYMRSDKIHADRIDRVREADTNRNDRNLVPQKEVTQSAQKQRVTGYRESGVYVENGIEVESEDLPF